MSRYDDYIARLCRTGKYTEDQTREFALSKEVDKYYQDIKSENAQIEKSTYASMGECI